MTQLVTTLISRINCSMVLIPENVENSDNLSILYSKPLWEFRKPKFEIEERVRILKYDSPFRKGYKPQFTQEVLEIVANSSRKLPTFTIEDEQDEVMRKFYQKGLIKVILQWNRFQWSWFQMHLRDCFQMIQWALLKTFCQSNWIWKVNGRLQFQNYPTHQCTKMSRRENLCFLTRNFQSRQTSTIWKLVFTFPLRLLLTPWTLSFKKDTYTAKVASQLKCLEERRRLEITLKMMDLVLHFLVRIWDTFSELMLVMDLE